MPRRRLKDLNIFLRAFSRLISKFLSSHFWRIPERKGNHTAEKEGSRQQRPEATGFNSGSLSRCSRAPLSTWCIALEMSLPAPYNNLLSAAFTDSGRLERKFSRYVIKKSALSSWDPLPTRLQATWPHGPLFFLCSVCPSSERRDELICVDHVSHCVIFPVSLTVPVGKVVGSDRSHESTTSPGLAIFIIRSSRQFQSWWGACHWTPALSSFSVFTDTSRDQWAPMVLSGAYHFMESISTQFQRSVLRRLKKQ